MFLSEKRKPATQLGSLQLCCIVTAEKSNSVFVLYTNTFFTCSLCGATLNIAPYTCIITENEKLKWTSKGDTILLVYFTLSWTVQHSSYYITLGFSQALSSNIRCLYTLIMSLYHVYI